MGKQTRKVVYYSKIEQPGNQGTRKGEKPS